MIGTQKTTIAQRLTALFDSLMKEQSGKIPAPFLPIANQLVKNFLKSADESELQKIIMQIRDEVIPFLLGPSNDNPNQ